MERFTVHEAAALVTDGEYLDSEASDIEEDPSFPLPHVESDDELALEEERPGDALLPSPSHPSYATAGPASLSPSHSPSVTAGPASLSPSPQTLITSKFNKP